MAPTPTDGKLIETPSQQALLRVAPVGEWVQDCALPAGCPDDGLDAARCVEVGGPFAPTWVDGEVVAIAVDAASVPALGLAPGVYWTAWGDGVTCTRVVVDFEVAP